MLVGSSRNRGEVKGQVFQTVEMLARMKAKREDQRGGPKKLPGEKGSSSGAGGRKWNLQSTNGETGLRQ